MFFVLLVARSVWCEREDGSLCAVADNPDAGPNVNCVGNAIVALRDEENAGAGIRSGFVYSLLECVGIVADAVGVDGKGVIGEIDRFAVFEFVGIKRLAVEGIGC